MFRSAQQPLGTVGVVPGESIDAVLPEQRARASIDYQLARAGWIVVKRKQDLNLFAGRGIALYEKVMAPGHGEADYILYVDRKVVGVIEAKKEGTPLAGVEWQSAMYASDLRLCLADGAVRRRYAGLASMVGRRR